MADEADEVIGSIGRQLVSHLAPEELPLYSSMLNRFLGGKAGRRRKRSSDDQLLGFGAAEVVTMITPVILSFSCSFWDALVAQAAQDSVHTVVEYVKAHRPGHHEDGGAPPPLTADQLQLVRTIAEREARRLDIPEKRAALLADAMVGVLAVPAVP
jgi:hypothetical protein